MEDYIEQYTPLAIEMGTNVLLALVILIVGSWVAARIGKFVAGIGAAHDNLDDTLFKFLGSVARQTAAWLPLIGCGDIQRTKRLIHFFEIQL